MKAIAVLTSGGDAPGMNAGIRATVRTALTSGLSVFGVKRGYQGLIEDDLFPMSSTDVSNILQRGGTILHSARSDEFRTPEGRSKAAENLLRRNIDGLIVFGGDGSFRGANDFQKEHGVRVIGVPATIDNDIWGSDFTIGFDSAVNTALEAMDKVRDTAAAHDRLFIVEVMGRHAGFIALEVGIGAGAEEILIPETVTDISEISRKVQARYDSGRTSSILVVAEGDDAGSAYDIAKKIEIHSGIRSRVTVLGHVQRGGSPTAADRMLATKLGYAAVIALLEDAAPCMVGVEAGSISRHPLADAWTRKKELDQLLVLLSSELE